MGKKITDEATPQSTGSGYPPPFDAPCMLRRRRRLGDAAGLSQFGVNLLTLPPGVWSSQRHWHTDEDEFIFVVSGEVVLITDGGEEILGAGECAGFKAGERDAHHLQNRTARDAVVLEVGSRRTEVDETFYPGLDLKALKNDAGFARLDGSRYPAAQPRKPLT